MTNSVQKYFLVLAILLSSMVFIPKSHAAKPVDHTGWKVDIGGYVDLDAIYDTTRSFTEVPNDGAVSAVGTTAGDNPRYQESARNTRFRAFATAPEENGWLVSGQLETDFNGFDPAPGSGSLQTEGGFYSSPTLRMRLAQIEIDKSDWKVIAGQAWSLFGWQPYYEMNNLTNDSVINVVNRNPLIWVQRDMNFNDDTKLEMAVQASRPAQRDAGIPDLSAGLNFSWGGRKAGYLTNTHAKTINAPTSIEVSGIFKNFTTPNTDGVDSDRTGYYGGGLAASALIPILTSSGDDTKGSLTLLGEFVKGNGLAEQYTGFSTGLTALNTGTGTTQFQPNMDAGYAGYDANGNFNLVQTQSFTAQLQYILPFENETVFNVSYASLHSPNSPNLFSSYGTGLGGVAQSAANAATFDNIEIYTVNLSYAITKQVRVAGEFDKFYTHYISGAYPCDSRLQTSVFYMF